MKRLQSRGRRAALAVALSAALTVPVAIFATGVTAQSSTAAQAQYAPSNTAAPTVSGTAQEGQQLTATTGTWSSSSNTTYAYQWQRCNTTGAACTDISGATSSQYTVVAADVGNRLRVVVTATNADGSTRANSATTAAVTSKSAQGTQPAGAIKQANGRTSIPASSVAAPERLVVDDVKFTPNPVRGRTTIAGRFHIVDTRGYDVREALVYVIGLPYSRVTQPGEARTGTDGWVTLQFQPDRFFPRDGYITFFVRTRKAGDDVLAGVSSRRLVQVTINR